jgi:hypothetical protein
MFTVNTFEQSMKRALVIVLMLLYGLTSSGMSLQVHFCCGEIAGIDLTPLKGCGMEHDMGSMPCCETKALEVKDLGDYEPQHLLTQFEQQLIPSIPFYDLAVVLQAVLLQCTPPATAPPLLHNGIYQWICVYRI